MANTSYGNVSAPYAEAGSVLSRTHWGGPDADRDLHLETYEKLIDQLLLLTLCSAALV